MNLRVSEAEVERIKAYADAAGMTVAEYARSRLLSRSTPQATIAASNLVEDRLAGVEDAVARARALLGAQPEE